MLRVGAPAPEIIARCGPPVTADRKMEETAVNGVAVQASVIETWVYDFGPEVFTRKLFFRDGTLLRIESGPYGYSR